MFYPKQQEDNAMKRFIVIVLDSAGIGELPDSKAYGDEEVIPLAIFLRT